ncbi:MAG TPA: hypothetical protein VHC69_24995 [Polyangiaceae bacterium]|nr:hypothetical protein [Polyangiaceae bacterium]
MLVRHQSTEYDLAFVLYMQRRRREALAILEQLLHPEDEAPDLRYQQYGTLLKSRIQAELSTLRVLVTPSTAQVRIDGEAPIERGPERWLVVDPGDHHVEISAPGYVTKQVVFATGAGTDVEREVVLDRASSPAPPAPTTAAHAAGSDSATGHTAVLAPWIVMGTGGALLVTAVVTGLLAKDADDDFQKGCPTNKDCSPSLVGLRDRVVTLGRTTDILLVSGGVLAAGGLTWRLLLPSPKATADHAAFVTVNGRF